MAIERIVFGVFHTLENTERAISLISPYVTSRNKVGLEVSGRELKLYDEINARKLPPEYARKALLDRICEERGWHYPENEDELPNGLSAALFWYGLYNGLRQSGAEIKGLGSEKRSRLLDKLLAECRRHPTCSASLRYDLIAGPHSDRFLTERMLESGCDRAVVGIAHATKVANKTDSKLVVIDDLPLDLKRMIDALEEVYQSKRHSLPDLRD
ncbi:hypothetical protein D6817_04245 [Candidatus Pacearchaeota archaeon]|nr:MAG: hypothetical protein D6817_04245 [Candidatus Pacearchaeota archaeon]